IMFKTIWFLNRLIHSGVSKHRSVVRLWSNAADGAVAPPADCRITAEQAIRLWAQHFTLHGISEPLLSSQYIISHVLGEKTLECVQRKRLRDTLTDRERERVWELGSKRLTRMPVQYVIEEWDFRDLNLKMRPPVFIPRPETEELVNLVLEDLRLIRGESHTTDLRCLEVGCGSGAISLSLLRSIPQLRVFALDQSQTAVCLTMENANRLGLQDRLDVHLLDVIKDADAILSKCNPVDFLISNPPYLLSQDMETLQTEILGLDLLGKTSSPPNLFLSYAFKCLCLPRRVYLEVAPCHPPIIQQLIEEMMPGLLYLETRCDLTNRPRFCILQKKGEDG
uniref:peptide chain release factor N(5)-glutamine methyltransferase n=1 Tax=Sinocyclocheilus anshuiensis TaxID=1608454 RepID=A0A671QQ47_9TELE